MEHLTAEYVYKAREHQVRKTQTQLEALFDNTLEGIAIKDAQGIVTRVNPSALRILRLASENQIVGYDILDPSWLVIREDGSTFPRDEFPSHLALSTGRPQSAKAMGVHLPNGELIWLSVSATPIRWDDRQQTSEIVVNFQDITAEKNSEIQQRALQKVLKKAISEFRHIFDKSPIGVIQTDKNRRYIRANKAYQDMLGYSETELHQLTVYDLTHPADLKVSQEISAAIDRGQQVTRQLKRKIRKDGSVIWVQVSSAPLEENEPDNTMISIVEDVTEQQRRKAELERLETIIQSTTDMIGWTSVTGDSYYFNSALTQSLGGLPGEAFNPVAHHPPTHQKRVHEEIIPTAIANGIWSGENVVLDAEKGEIPVSQVVLCHKDPEGQPAYLSTIMRDISDAKRAEANLIEASKMSALGRMSTGIAHEINNPLTIIIGKVIQLQNAIRDQDRTPEEMLYNLERIEKNALRISKIVSGLRAYARDADHDPYVATKVRTVIDDTLELCQGKYQSLGIDFRHPEFSPELKIDCRPTQIEQILFSLLNNACDAVISQPVRWILLEVLDLGDSIEIAVTDSGPGVPLEIRGKIMDPFFSTKGPSKGVGLGLSIAESLAKGHGGSLRLDIESPNTRFLLRLPKTRS